VRIGAPICRMCGAGVEQSGLRSSACTPRSASALIIRSYSDTRGTSAAHAGRRER
jgi:hypothetical protein